MTGKLNITEVERLKLENELEAELTILENMGIIRWWYYGTRPTKHYVSFNNNWKAREILLEKYKELLFSKMENPLHFKFTKFQQEENRIQGVTL